MPPLLIAPPGPHRMDQDRFVRRHTAPLAAPAPPASPPPAAAASAAAAGSGAATAAAPVAPAAAAAATSAGSPRRDSPPPLVSRRLSLSASALPPLDFSTLCSLATSEACASTARRHVSSLTRALSVVRPYLCVSGVEAARDAAALAAHRVAAVVNLAAVNTPDYHAPRLAYLSLAARDDLSEDIGAHFDDTTAFIDAARRTGSAALVHCHVGVSRSVTVAAAYLIMADGLTVDAALADISRARPIADPNATFLRALHALAARVRGGRPAPALYHIRAHAPASRLRRRHYVAAAAAPPPPGQPLDDADVWIVAAPRAGGGGGGVTLACGARAGAAEWARGREIAARMAAHEERYEAQFPVARGGGGGGGGGRRWACPLTVIERAQWSAPLAERLADAARGGRGAAPA